MGFTVLAPPQTNNVYGRFMSCPNCLAFPCFRFIQLVAVNVLVKGGDETIEGVI